MTLRHVLAALAASTTLLHAHAETAADSFPVDIGGRAIAVPVPAGMVDPANGGTLMLGLLTNNLPANYRLLALKVDPAINGDDFGKVGAPVEASRYCVIVTYRRFEAEGMAPALFEGIKRMLREQADAVLKAAATRAAGMEDGMQKDMARLSGDKSAKLTVGEHTSLGVFDDQPNSVALAASGKVAVSSKQYNDAGEQVSTISLVLIHGKPLGAMCYSDYATQDDLAWAQREARDWIRRAGELNP